MAYTKMKDFFFNCIKEMKLIVSFDRVKEIVRNLEIIEAQ